MNVRAMDQGTFALAAWTVLLRRDMNATGADLRDAIRNASDADAAALVAYCAHPANGGYSAVEMEAAALIFLCSGGGEEE